MYHAICNWYKENVPNTKNSKVADINKISDEYKELYKKTI